MQLWQVLLVFGGVPLALFCAIWALVWLVTKPGTVPPGVAQPSDAPSGGMPRPKSQEADEGPNDACAEGTGQAGGEIGDQE